MRVFDCADVDCTDGTLGTLDIASTAPLAVYLLDGDRCAGPELRCSTSPANDSVSFTFSSADNGDYVLVVEDLEGYEDAFQITSSCVI